MSSPRYRYPGVKPYESAQSALFFGRDRDIDQLYSLIQQKNLVVLYGKSGYGKSSLLNAGLIPELQERPVAELTPEGEETSYVYQPIVVRFGAYVANQSSSPLEKLLESLPDQPQKGGEFLSKWLLEHELPATLWAEFKRRQKAEPQHFVLLFDQFEEFFSYPIEQQYAFRVQLDELLHERVPPAIREHWSTLSPTQKSFVSRPMDVRVVTAIRSDRLSDLDSMKHELPAILLDRYELRALTPEQARESILGPADLDDEKYGPFLSTRFEYTKPALDEVLKNLAAGATSDTGNEGVEAFQLQILCENIERRVIEGKVPDRDQNGLPDVDTTDLPDFENLFADYYRRKLGELSDHEREAAELLIEGLVHLDTGTGQARRRIMDRDFLLEEFKDNGVTDTLLENLENTFLIRKEMIRPGVFHYEVSHDTLLPPIVDAKTQRHARMLEKKAREEKARADEEARQRKEAEKLKDQAVRGRKRANIFAGIALGFALIAAVVGWSAWIQRGIAIKAKDDLEKTKEREDEARKKSDLLSRELLLRQYTGYLESANSILNIDSAECPTEFLKKAKEIADLYSDDSAFQTPLKNLEQRMRHCIGN